MKFLRLWRAICLLAVPLACVSGCRRPPSITISQIPPAAAGGAGTQAVIGGRVIGGHHARNVILYAFSGGRWWVQPLASSPITAINYDGTWSAKTHLGSKYAAILTKDETLPSSSRQNLPEVGENVEAVAVVNGGVTKSASPSPVGKTIRFSGYDWSVRPIPGEYTSRTFPYSKDNVFVDQDGALHLRMTKKDDDFVCAELHSVRSLGYGTYHFELRDVGQLEAATMFSIFSRVDAPADNDARELDIHVSKLGDAAKKNAEYVVQPYFVPQNSYHFDLPSGPISLELDWSLETARFSATTGQAPLRPITEWKFTTGVPIADDGLVFLNLCAYGYARVPPQHDAEVVVKRFDFFP